MKLRIHPTVFAQVQYIDAKSTGRYSLGRKLQFNPSKTWDYGSGNA